MSGTVPTGNRKLLDLGAVPFPDHRRNTDAAATLKKTLSGRRVPQDPNDEPASTLLERIRAERAAATQSKPSRKCGHRNAKHPQEAARNDKQGDHEWGKPVGTEVW
jgi:hypothetical protein